MYCLLPFRFFHLDGHDILVNEVGDYLITEEHSAEKIILRTIARDSNLYKDL